MWPIVFHCFSLINIQQDWHSRVYSGRLEYICRLKFTLLTGISGWNLWLTHHNTHETYLIYPIWLRSLNTPGLPITSGTLWACRSSSRSERWHCFHRISFCYRVYMYVHGMRYLHHEVYELDGYNQEFWKTSGYSLKCVLQLVASTSHAKVPSKEPHSTGLSRTSSKT